MKGYRTVIQRLQLSWTDEEDYSGLDDDDDSTPTDEGEMDWQEGGNNSV